MGSEPQRGSTAHHPALWAVSESPPRLRFVLEIKGMWLMFLSGQPPGSSVFPCVAGVGRGWDVGWGILAGKWLLSSRGFADLGKRGGKCWYLL